MKFPSFSFRFWFVSLAASAILGLSSGSNIAEAQFKVALSPLEKSLVPPRAGARVTDELTIANTSPQALYFSSEIMDWTREISGQQKFVEGGTTPLSCAPWISLNPPQFQLNPGQSIKVRYSIAPPAEITREHRAIIFFTSRPIPMRGKANIVNLVSVRLGAKVFLAPSKTPPSGARISEIIAPAEGDLRLKMQNEGAVSLRAKSAKIEAFDAAGTLVGNGELAAPDAQIHPGDSRELPVKWTQQPPSGKTRFRVVVDYGGLTLAGAENTLDWTPKTLEAPVVEALPER